DQTLQPCGLCLRPYPMCKFYLKKIKGAGAKPKVDYTKSICANPLEFHYSIAETSTRTGPCSNVPLPCPRCPPGAPVIWHYNLCCHLVEEHPSAGLKDYEEQWAITEAEKVQLKEIWNTKHQIRKQHK
ncbi:hypothetical protein BDQ17DRAFT_1175437, partial [Cyathus striatus]